MNREQKIAAKVAEAQFAGMTESAVAAALNAPDPTLTKKRVDVATSEAREILLSTGEWGAVVLAAENTAAPQQVRGACIVLRDTIAETSLIRASVPAIYNATATLLGGLTPGVLTEGTRDALMALADVPQSWAEQQGVGTVEIRDIGIARGNN
jgi:hypothetical protein